MNQANLFEPPAVIANLPFSGTTFEPQFDAERLTGQYRRVWDVMKYGDWRTLTEIQNDVFALFSHFDSEAAISARLRDFRKLKFGGHTVNRRRRGEASRGLWEYQLQINETS